MNIPKKEFWLKENNFMVAMKLYVKLYNQKFFIHDFINAFNRLTSFFNLSFYVYFIKKGKRVNQKVHSS